MMIQNIIYILNMKIFNFLKIKSHFIKFNYKNIKTQQRINNSKFISPEEIRQEIQKMRVENQNKNFSNFDGFYEVNNNNELIKLFKNYINETSKKIQMDYYQHPNIFEELKILLKSIQSSNDSDEKFFEELIKL